VSDGTVGSASQGVLWQHAVSAGIAVTHRLFIWHLNKKGTSLKIGVTLQNSSSQTIRVTNVKRQTDQTTQFLSLGKCIAKAVLGGTLDSYQPTDPEISASAVGLVEEFSWSANTLRGAQYEFTVEPTMGGPFGYVLRTAFGTPSTNLPGLTAAPLPKGGPHPRGSWPGSEITLDCIYGIGMNGVAPVRHYRLGTGQLQSPPNDFLFRADNSQLPDDAVHNKGNYGAIYRIVRLNVHNYSQQARALQIFLNPRGGTFAGACTLPKL
jgi:hypothetical protein